LKNDEWIKIKRELELSDEDKIIRFLKERLSQIEGYTVLTEIPAHGAGEHGVDIVAVYKDPIGSEFLCYFQVKVGKMGVKKWRSEVKGQLDAMLDQSLELPGIKKDIPLRRILVHVGKMTQDAQREFVKYCEQHHPRVELWNIDNLITIARKTTDIKESKALVHLFFNIQDGEMPQFDAMYFPQEFGRQVLEKVFSSDELKEKLRKAYNMSDIKGHAHFLKSRENVLIQLGEWMILNWLTHGTSLPEEFFYVGRGLKIKDVRFEDLPPEIGNDNELIKRLEKTEMRGFEIGLKQLPMIPETFALKSPEPGTLVLEGESVSVKISVEIAGQWFVSSITTGGWGRFGRYLGLPLTKHLEKKIMEGMMKPWRTADLLITLSKGPGTTTFVSEYKSIYEKWVEGLFATFRPWFDWNYYVEQRLKGSEFDEIKNMLEILGINIEDIRKKLGLGELRTE
jgi:hypothetical protein